MSCLAVGPYCSFAGNTLASPKNGRLNIHDLLFNMTRYSNRLNAFKPTKIWTVEDKGVRWSDQNKQGASGFIPLENIKAIRLRSEPSRAETRRVGLHIYAPHDYHITNVDYIGPLNFDVRESEFRGFVLALHQLFPAETDTKFYKGSTSGTYIINLLLTFFVVACLLYAAPMMAKTGLPGGTTVLRLVIILGFLPLLIKMMIRNKPSTYHPDDIPMEMLR